MGISEACCAASRHIVQIEVGVPFSPRVGDAEIVAVRARVRGKKTLGEIGGGRENGRASCRERV